MEHSLGECTFLRIEGRRKLQSILLFSGSSRSHSSSSNSGSSNSSRRNSCVPRVRIAAKLSRACALWWATARVGSQRSPCVHALDRATPRLRLSAGGAPALWHHGNCMPSKEKNLCLSVDLSVHASCTLLPSVTLLLYRGSFFHCLSCSLSLDTPASLSLSLSLASPHPRFIFVLVSLCYSLSLSRSEPALSFSLSLSTSLSGSLSMSPSVYPVIIPSLSHCSSSMLLPLPLPFSQAFC
jgi:hypothetical protein